MLDDGFQAVAERRDTDSDGDGTVESSVFDDTPSSTFDAERIEVYTYDGGGRRTRTRSDTDASGDGTYERDETHFYGIPGQPAQRTHTVVDDGADGTPDSLVFEDVEFTFEPTAQEVMGSLVGVTTIRLAGADDITSSAASGRAAGLAVTGTADRLALDDGVVLGSTESARATGPAGFNSATLTGGSGGGTTIVITDAVLTALAGGTSDYVLTIDGGSADTVALPGFAIGRITGDGATDDDGRVGYEGTDGKVYVDQDVTVARAVDGAVLEEFGADSDDGITVAESRSTVTFSFPDDGAGGTKVSVRFDGDLPIESRVFEQASAFRASRDVDTRMTEIDLTDDGTFAAESWEFHTLDVDGNRVETSSLSRVSVRTITMPSGTEEREEIDFNGDGTVDRVDLTTFIDSDGDGAADISRTDSDFDGTADRRVERVERDRSADGTVDLVESYTYDAAGRLVQSHEGPIRQTYRYDAASRLLRIEVDRSDDGTTFVADEVATYSRDAAGRVVRAEIDGAPLLFGDIIDNAPDGTAEQVETYSYDAANRVVRVDFDGDQFTPLDGTVDRTLIYRYTDDGTSQTIAVFEPESGGTVLRYSYDSDGNLVMMVSENHDGGVVRSSARMYSYNEDGGSSEAFTDSDYDGTTFEPDRARVYSYGEDGGTAESLIDDDYDGTTFEPDRIDVSDRTEPPDGTAPITTLTRYANTRIETYINDNGNRVETRFDNDADGTVDAISHFFGPFLPGAGGHLVEVMDSDADGTADGAEFASRAGTWEIAAADAAGDLAGLPEITMAADADGTVVVTDAVLTALAGSDSAYSLRVDGDSGDTVRIAGPGISDAGTTETVGGQDYDVWQGTDGTLLVDPDLQVVLA